MSVGIILAIIGVSLVIGGIIHLATGNTRNRSEAPAEAGNGGGFDLMNMDMSLDLMEIGSRDGHLRRMLQADVDMRRKVEDLIDFYQPSSGRISTWWNAGKVEGQVRLLESLGAAQRHVVEQAALLEREALANDKAHMEFKVFIAQNVVLLHELKAKVLLIQKSSDAGMSPEHYSDVNQYRAKAEIDKDVYAWKTEQNLSAAERYKMTEDEITNRLRNQLKAALLELDEFEQDSSLTERAKGELIESKKNQIANLKFRISAREKRLADDEAAL